MNPLWVLLSILVGANLGGVFGSALGALAGALVAIPVGGAVQVIAREVWQRTKATGPGRGRRPRHRPWRSTVRCRGLDLRPTGAAGVAPRP